MNFKYIVILFLLVGCSIQSNTEPEKSWYEITYIDQKTGKEEIESVYLTEYQASHIYDDCGGLFEESCSIYVPIKDFSKINKVLIHQASDIISIEYGQ